MSDELTAENAERNGKKMDGKKMQETNLTAESAETFTLEKLRAMAASMPKVSNWQWCVAKPEYVARLKAETKLAGHLGHTLAFGIEVFPKMQNCDCWMFSDRDALQKYLRDELTEADLIEFAVTGKCSQQSFSE